MSTSRFSTGTGGSATVTSTSSLVLPRLGGRQYALLVNDSDQTMYLNFGSAAVLNSGIPLLPTGGAIEITGENLFVGDVYAICTSGSKNLTLFYA